MQKGLNIPKNTEKLTFQDKLKATYIILWAKKELYRLQGVDVVDIEYLPGIRSLVDKFRIEWSAAGPLATSWCIEVLKEKSQ